MVVNLTLLPLTMILGLPLMSACSDQPSPEDRLSGCTGDKFWVNVTRRNDGDALISSCPRCGDLCRQAKAVRLRCDLREYPCTCRCPYNQTFRTDINLCVDSFPVSSFSASKPTTITLIDTGKNTSASEHCRVRKTSVFKCGDWINLNSLNITQDRGIWAVAKETDSAGRNVWWTGSLDAFQSLSGYLLYLEISCDSNTSTSCTVVKMAGTRGYAVSTGYPLFPTTDSDIATEGGVHSLPVTNNVTAGNKTSAVSDEEIKQLEMLVTAVCLSVALLLCVWLTCFAVEKRVQSKKRGSEKQFASQTRTYPHEVAHVRKTLMDVYDMPMIRFNMSGGEDDEGASLTTMQPKKKEREPVIPEVLPDHEADGEESTSPSSSELRAETGSSSETLTDTPAVQPGYLGVPKNSDDQEFKNWRPCLKQLGSSKKSPPLSPTKKRAVPPGILKKSPNTSPTRSPTRSPPMPRRSPMKSILIKRSPTLHKRWKTAVSRHFQHPNQNHAVASDVVEMKPVNGMNTEPRQTPGRSILKHGSRWRALTPKLVPMVQAEELDEDLPLDHGDKKHKVVIKCDIHHENERRDTDQDSDEKAYTEKSPLTRSIKMVLDPRLEAPSKKNCIEWRCEDFDGVPCTDV